MAGSIAEAMDQINSLKPGELKALATKVREAAAKSATGGATLLSCAKEVGAQSGDPYAAFHDRLAPVGTWLIAFEQPAVTVATSLDNAGTVAQDARQEATRLIDELARQPQPAGPNAAAAMKAAEGQVLAQLNVLIENVSGAYDAVLPADPGTAPVNGTGGADAATAGGTDGRTQPATAGADAAGTGATAGSGPFDGWVKDPVTGNLIDPATGREVNAAGQFLDPVTGLPFTDAAARVSRLEGLQGGVDATGGLFGVTAGAGAFAAPSGGSTGGGAPFAGLYGGVVPPSLMGSNPAMGQLAAKANQNLQDKAAFAQRYAALASGQEQGTRPYMPPMGGAGGGMAGGGGRSTTRSSRRLVSEPSSVWGAAGREERDEAAQPSSRGAKVVEDADVWTGGESPTPNPLDR